MSLLLSPLILYILGMGLARISKARRVWRKHSRFVPYMSALLLVGYFLLTISLFVDLTWVQGLVARLPGETGTDWMINSGFMTFDASWPIEDQALMFVIIAVFASFPLWFYLGVMSGFWLFGRSPRQTGILGLLR